MPVAIGDDLIKFRVSSRAKEKWSALAETDNMSLSAWVKDACKSKARGEQVREREIITTLNQIRVNLASGIGNNLNQVAKYYNTTGKINDDLDALICDLAIVVKQIELLTKEFEVG